MTLPINILQFPAFLLVFVRVTSFVVTMPVTGERMVPPQVKIGLSLLLTLALFPVVAGSWAARIPDQPLAWIPAIVMEILLGAAIGYVVRLIAISLEFAGEVIGYTLGLSMAQAIDPQTHYQVPIMGQFLSVMGFLIFLAINAHHQVIQALAASFEWIPPMGVSITHNFTDLMITLTFQVFQLGLQIAAPVVAAMLLTNVGLGIVARTVPQMNVMMVIMPLTIAIGLVVFGLSLPFVAHVVSGAYAGLGDTLANLFWSMK